MSSSYTDITYAKVIDMWKHPETLTIVEYALVKYILNNDIYEGRDHDECDCACCCKAQGDKQ
jgi:hypothetical protein